MQTMVPEEKRLFPMVDSSMAVTEGDPQTIKKGSALNCLCNSSYSALRNQSRKGPLLERMTERASP